MLESKRRKRARLSQKGQNAIEYMLVLCIVIITLMAFVGPGGHFFGSLNYTLHTTHNTVEQMAHSIYYNVYNEPGTCVCDNCPASCLNCPGLFCD